MATVDDVAAIASAVTGAAAAAAVACTESSSNRSRVSSTLPHLLHAWLAVQLPPAPHSAVTVFEQHLTHLFTTTAPVYCGRLLHALLLTRSLKSQRLDDVVH